MLQYIAKDCSKAETKSKSYNDLAREVLSYISSRQPLLSFVSKIMGKMIAERDVSAQEVCHTLLMQGIRNLSGLRDERTKLQKEQSEKFAAMAGELRVIWATLSGARADDPMTVDCQPCTLRWMRRFVAGRLSLSTRIALKNN